MSFYRCVACGLAGLAAGCGLILFFGAGTTFEGGVVLALTSIATATISGRVQ